MLDPLSALAVAASCVQFLDFTWKVVTQSIAIFNKTNSTARRDELSQVADNLRRLSAALVKSKPGSDHRNAIYKLSDECQSIETELTKVLDRLKDKRKSKLDPTAHGTSRRWASARQALLHGFGDNKFAELEQRLEQLRQRLTLIILLELREEHNNKLESLPGQGKAAVTSTKPIGQEFLDVVEDKERWQKDLIEAILNEETDNPRLAANSNLDRLTIKYFLEDLAYDEMSVRFSHVSHAFDDTFKWLFVRSSESQTWPDFQEWLTNALESTYWISGKPGSGKSTLMKYIASQDQTEEELKRWATPLPLVRASFYFWSGGSRLYKSMEGLLRSLLHQVFESNSRLITKYCPRRAEVHQLLGRYSLPWTMEELEDTISKVPEDGEARFFFLIDGLDECIDDQENLVRFLDRLTKEGNVKLCLSSRPWQDFEDSYKDGPHLKLHEMTMPDIRHFVNAKLNQSRGFADLKKRDKSFADSLVEEITLKSQGVFIWVQFVVRAILIDLKDGSLIEIINGRLRELPEDLEDLFQKLLDIVEPSYKEVAHQIFRLVQASHAPMTLLTLSFAHEDGKMYSVSKFGGGSLSLTEMEGRCNMMRRRLNSHCKGLLEVVPASTAEADCLDLGDPTAGDSDPIEALDDPMVDEDVKRIQALTRCTVQYMHRTVKDFLEKPAIWKSFSDVVTSSSFNPYAALSRASLIQLKIMSIETSTTQFFWSMVGDVLYYAALSETESEESLISELDELDKAADVIARTSWPRGKPGNLIQRHMGASIQGQRVPNRIQNQNEQRLHWSAVQATGGSTHSFLCLAVQYGLCSYVEAKLNAGTLVEQPQGSRSLLDCAIRDPKLIGTLEPPPLRFDRRLSMLKLLLAHGDDPNKVDAFRTTPWIYLESQIKSSNGPKRPTERRYSRVFVARSPTIPTKPPPSASSARVGFWMSAAELFVENGANCWAADYKALVEVFESFDKDRAMALKKSMKTRRFSPLQIWNSSIRRKSTGSAKVIVETDVSGAKGTPDITVLQVDASATT